MKRRTLVLLFAVVALFPLLVAPANSHEQVGLGDWYWQKPVPQGNTLYDVQFTSAANGWAVGAHGTILKTTDGGANWSVNYSRTNNYIGGAYFLDDANGWAVGSRGMIMHTTDAGAHWEIKYVSNGADVWLHAVRFASQTVGWAVGGDYYNKRGVIYRTTDGGGSWTNVTPTGTQGEMNDVFCTSASEAWVVGTKGVILHTTNTGQDWTGYQMPVNDSTPTLYSVQFTSETEGWVSGSNGALLHTVNRGVSWDIGTALAGSYLYDLQFVSPDEAWAVGEDGIVVHTINGADTWTQVNPGPLSVGCRAVFFRTATDGWIVGQGGTILHTTDGGTTWSPYKPTTDEQLNGIAVIDSNTAVAVGVTQMARTTNGGNTWTTATVHPLINLNDVAMGTAQIGWAVAKDGKVTKTTNAGASWGTIVAITNRDLWGVDAVDANTAWAVGDSTVYGTTNGGSSWDSQTLPTGAHLMDVAFLDANTGWVVGHTLDTQDAIIFRTDNGGTTWVRQAISGASPDGLNGIFIKSQTELWAVGDQEVILHTTNGGNTWTWVDSGLRYAYNLNAVTFASDNEGWIMGQLGTTLHTTDGGLTWDVAYTGSANDMLEVGFADDGTLWAVGEEGTIISSEDPDWATSPVPPVRELVPTPGDTQMLLTWNRPKGAHIAATRVLRSSSGIAVEPTPTAGQTQIYEGTAETCLDQGLTNGTTYFYTVFNRDELGRWSAPTFVACAPVEPPPGPVTGFRASSLDAQVLLAWTNPTDTDYAQTRILRSPTGFADSPAATADQTVVYQGADVTLLDESLTNGATYYYTAFAQDEDGAWSERATVSAMPMDSPPQMVRGFTAQDGEGQVLLSWAAPEEPDVVAVRVLRSETAYADGADDTSGQTILYEDSGTSCIDGGMPVGMGYYYTAFARDATGNWSRYGATARGRSVYDTSLALSSDVTLCAYGAGIWLTGNLQDDGVALPAMQGVGVWRSGNSGASWTYLGQAPYDWSRLGYRAQIVPTANSLYQMRFSGDWLHGVCTSNNVEIKVRAHLPTPMGPSTLRLRGVATISGLLLPAHSGTTALRFYRYVSSRWRLYTTRYATNTSSGGWTKYVARYRLPYRGRWYVKAYHSDADHAATYSNARYIRVL